MKRYSLGEPRRVRLSKNIYNFGTRSVLIVSPWATSATTAQYSISFNLVILHLNYT